MHTIVGNSIESVGGPKVWDALGVGQAFQSSRWYQFGETVMDSSRVVYAIVLDGGQPIARASFWRVPNEPLVLGYGGVVAACFKRWPLMICRSPFSGNSGLIIPPPPLREEALEEIAKTGRRLRRQEKASLLLMDGLDKSTAHAWPRGISYSFGKPGSILNVHFRNFDEYIASLPNKERRDIRRDLREIEKRRISVSRHRTVADLDAVERLYRKVEARNGSAHNPWLRSMLKNMDMVNGTLLTAHVEGQLVGCAAIFEDSGAQLGTAMGLDDDVPYVYFALLYETIRLGLEHGLHSLYWGAGASAVKKRLGFSTFENNSVAIVF